MILLTGASGFIGRHLLKALVVKYGRKNVLALTSDDTSKNGLRNTGISEEHILLHHNYTFAPDYFEKQRYADKITAIIHAGAFTPKNASQANDARKCDSNIASTNKLLQCSFPALKNFIYLSTLDVYGPDDVISEKSALAPASLYGQSKLRTEQLVAEWTHANNTICQILRLGHVYGPGEESYEKIIPSTFKKILNKETVRIWGSGDELRCFIYVEDAVKAIVNALELKETVGAINIANDKPVSVIGLVQKIAAACGLSANIEYVSSETKARNFLFDITKLRRYLLSEQITLDEGLKQEYAYLKSLSHA